MEHSFTVRRYPGAVVVYYDDSAVVQFAVADGDTVTVTDATGTIEPGTTLIPGAPRAEIVTDEPQA
jgi:hypothetical protein